MSEETILSSRVVSSLAGKSLLDYLCGRFKYYSQDAWDALIREGKVAVNGERSQPGRRLEKNDIVSYRTVLREPPVDADIAIIHEEESFIVAGKPGNLPSHGDGNYIKNTFIYLLRHRLAEEGHRGPVKLVHRLDRETSGIILTAKTDQAHRALTRQFEAGTVMKEYLAVARGAIEEEHLEISGAIARDDGSAISIKRRVVPVGTEGSRAAATRFEVLERLRGFTLVLCLPSTGRTNQIRIHLAHIGHPIAGDKLYGRSDEEFLEYVRRARAGIHEPLPWMESSRHLLHAAALTIDHPLTGERVTFRCPTPPDMNAFIAAAR